MCARKANNVASTFITDLVGACLATGDRIFATGSGSVSKIVWRSCCCCCLLSGIQSGIERAPEPKLSGPVLRDTARLSQRYPPIVRYGVSRVSTWPIGCDTPSPFTERFPRAEHTKWRCDTPLQKGYLSDTGAIPHENKANGCATPLCDTISKRYCAIGAGWGYLALGH